MKWISVKNNYHIKYENYFKIDNNRIVINTHKYYLHKINFILNTVELIIKQQPKIKITKHDIFAIYDFANLKYHKKPLHCIYWKKNNENKQKIINGEIIEDLVKIEKTTNSYNYKIIFKIKN